MMWNENQEGKEMAFVGYTQILTDNTGEALKGSGLVVYPMHAVLLNF